MTTIWQANTASLLLPVSNLTNLLAADRVALEPTRFAARMWLPQLSAILTTAVLLWVFHWRAPHPSHAVTDPPEPSPLPRRYRVPDQHRPACPLLSVLCALACLLLVAGLLLGAPLQIASTASAGLALLAFAVARRSALHLALVPWRLLVFVTGLFLVIQTINRHGFGDLMTTLIGTDPGSVGTLRAAAVGATLANIVNNLPAYIAGEAAVPTGNSTQLLGLLIGTNVGPVVTPWASLATLLWFERCHAWGVRIHLRTFLLTGGALATTALLASVGVLMITA